ncbi:hypothetical protein, partial [Solemya velum gill symbiont]|uniref:hypothetical protein n=1 Tax=Solemya velum gill symbiont TaxID=2340 RepID=UPI001C4E051B
SCWQVPGFLFRSSCLSPVGVNDKQIHKLIYSLVISDANHAIPTVNGVPELHSFCSHVTHLIQTITERALINEEKNFLPDLSNDQRTHSPIITPKKAARAVTLTPGYS